MKSIISWILFVITELWPQLVGIALATAVVAHLCRNLKTWGVIIPIVFALVAIATMLTLLALMADAAK